MTFNGLAMTYTESEVRMKNILMNMLSYNSHVSFNVKVTFIPNGLYEHEQSNKTKGTGIDVRRVTLGKLCVMYVNNTLKV